MKVGTIKLVWAALGMSIFLVATPILWGYVHGCPHLARRLLFGIFAMEYVPGSTVEFRRLSAGHGQGTKGADFEIFQFRSSDCVEVDSFYLKFVSSEDPREEMDRRINSAMRIVSPKAEITLDGGDCGERAVILGEREYVILRRIGKALHSIASPSLNHALEFERRDRFEMQAD